MKTYFTNHFKIDGIGIGTIKNTFKEYKITGTVTSPINKKERSAVVHKTDIYAIC